MSGQDAAPRVLTAGEVVALPLGAVVDATVAGARVRAMRVAPGSWRLSKRLDESPYAGNLELTEVVIVTDAPILPAPVAPLPLPTTAGEWFWGKTRNSEPQRWFVQHSSHGALWYIPGLGDDLAAEGAARVGLVRLPDPSETEAGA